MSNTEIKNPNTSENQSEHTAARAPRRRPAAKKSAPAAGADKAKNRAAKAQTKAAKADSKPAKAPKKSAAKAAPKKTAAPKKAAAPAAKTEAVKTAPAKSAANNTAKNTRRIAAGSMPKSAQKNARHISRPQGGKRRIVAPAVQADKPFISQTLQLVGKKPPSLR
ncbi:MAG: hypothetical protein IJE71_03605, partial [Clostridia bacterium]|nr:hypothetical protein [Clostridia bacterium]